MAIVNAMANSFKAEILQAIHNFTLTTGDVFKLALYLTSATLGAGDTVYKTSGEVATGGNYAAGGLALTNVTPTLDTTTGITDFQDLTWSSSTITAGGAMIYNSSKANRTVVTLTFGGDKVSAAGDFIVQFPPPVAATAIIRIA